MTPETKLVPPTVSAPRPKPISDAEDDSFAPGKHVDLFVPPSWIIAGTVDVEYESAFTLKDAVYVESVTQGSSSVSHLPLATDAKEQAKSVSSCYKIPDGTRFRKDGVLILFPAGHDFKAMSRSKEAEALKKAGGSR